MGEAAQPAVAQRRPKRMGMIVGGLVVFAIAAVVATVTLSSASIAPPDASLAQIDREIPTDVLGLVETENNFQVVDSSLQAHQRFHGWELFSGTNDFGSPCLVAIAPTRDFVRIECTPAPAHVVADTHPYTMPDGPMIRFILDGDHIEAWVYPHVKARR
jgi:hypothetical protein